MRTGASDKREDLRGMLDECVWLCREKPLVGMDPTPANSDRVRTRRVAGLDVER